MMMRLRLLLTLLFAVPAFAGDAALTLMPPSEPVVAGRMARVDIVAINPGSTAIAFDVEGSPSGTLRIGTESWPISLETLGAPPRSVSPGGFAVRRYAFGVPSAATGRAILELIRADGSVLRGVVDVTAAPATTVADAAASPPAEATPLDRLSMNTPASSSFARSLVGRFIPNQPVYFIYGNSDQAAKFQFSFDYRLASGTLGPVGQQTLVSLRGGYTQRSLWDINSVSSPFYDTSYMPELAIETDAPMPRDPNAFFTWLGLRAGVQHESNGRASDDSRSLNTVYVRPRLALGSLQGLSLVLLPEIWTYVGDLSDNRTIKDYRGYGRLRLYLGRNDGPSLLFSGWAGKDFDHKSFQLDLAVPTHVGWLNFESFFYLQYFNGYGESLRDFDRRSDALRAGISLVR